MTDGILNYYCAYYCANIVAGPIAYIYWKQSYKILKLAEWKLEILIYCNCCSEDKDRGSIMEDRDFRFYYISFMMNNTVTNEATSQNCSWCCVVVDTAFYAYVQLKSSTVSRLNRRCPTIQQEILMKADLVVLLPIIR